MTVFISKKDYERLMKAAGVNKGEVNVTINQTISDEVKKCAPMIEAFIQKAVLQACSNGNKNSQ